MEGRILLECADDRIEEVDNILILLVFGSIAGDVKGGGTCRVFRELVMKLACVFNYNVVHATYFMCPEISIGGSLTDPILVH